MKPRAARQDSVSARNRNQFCSADFQFTGSAEGCLCEELALNAASYVWSWCQENVGVRMHEVLEISAHHDGLFSDNVSVQNKVRSGHMFPCPHFDLTGMQLELGWAGTDRILIDCNDAITCIQANALPIHVIIIFLLHNEKNIVLGCRQPSCLGLISEEALWNRQPWTVCHLRSGVLLSRGDEEANPSNPQHACFLQVQQDALNSLCKNSSPQLPFRQVELLPFSLLRKALWLFCSAQQPPKQFVENCSKSDPWH